jgi:hypothetical protein
MSKERELLKKILNTGWLNHELSCEVEELLSQPEQEPFAVVANNSVGFDVSHSVQGMPLLWLGKLEHGDKLYRVRARDE